jgi:two-component system sensor histidine kinase RpfC
MRLLIADDQPANIMVLTRLLEKSGHQAIAVHSGEEVLTAIENDHFDGVIIDLHMPGISGLDVLKQVRVMEAGQDLTPFIVLSADATATTVRECEQAGARMFLTKPVAVNRLLEALSDIALGRSDALAPAKPLQAQPGASSAETEGAEPIVSRAMLEELADLQLSDGFIGLFIDECLRDALRSIGDLEKSGKAAQWDVFRDQCHALKGVASNMGAVRLANAASTAMKMANWQYPREWRIRIAGLRELLELTRVALKPESATRLEGEADRTP